MSLICAYPDRYILKAYKKVAGKCCNSDHFHGLASFNIDFKVAQTYYFLLSHASQTSAPSANALNGKPGDSGQGECARCHALMSPI